MPFNARRPFSATRHASRDSCGSAATAGESAVGDAGGVRHDSTSAETTAAAQARSPAKKKSCESLGGLLARAATSESADAASTGDTAAAADATSGTKCRKAVPGPGPRLRHPGWNSTSVAATSMAAAATSDLWRTGFRSLVLAEEAPGRQCDSVRSHLRRVQARHKRSRAPHSKTPSFAETRFSHAGTASAQASRAAAAASFKASALVLVRGAGSESGLNHRKSENALETTALSASSASAKSTAFGSKLALRFPVFFRPGGGGGRRGGVRGGLGNERFAGADARLNAAAPPDSSSEFLSSSVSKPVGLGGKAARFGPFPACPLAAAPWAAAGFAASRAAFRMLCSLDSRRCSTAANRA
mmetsp:Transcript_17506/g.59106  ORF Transcript_17506/g.59106 Transcript_17506/m.59106 type:complete len:358 (+) Transcript_17506:916-1989(+)